MSQEKMHETPLNVRERARKVKQFLTELRKKYKKIAIVSHFYTIRFLCSKEFDLNHEPKDKIIMMNCSMLSKSLAEISQYE